MNKQQLTLCGALLLAGTVLGYGLSLVTSPEAPSGNPKKEKKIQYWVAPMDPNYRSDKPGKSPMGMDLIPVYEEDAVGKQAQEPSLRIAPAVVQNLGVRTDKVTRSTLHKPLETVGYVMPDDNKSSHIHVRAEGWIEKLYVKTENEQVRKGEPLFRIYSPQIVTAQSEFLQLLNRGNQALIRASAERLRALGLQKSQIDTLRKSREVRNQVDIFAPQDGVILALNVGEGMYVKPGNTIMRLADLSTVWVMAEIFENQIPWIMKGHDAEMTIAGEPGKSWKGSVDYIYPVVDPVSRTVKLRLQFDNSDGLLRPNMYSRITIKGTALEDVLNIPREALIRTGTSERVILALGEGKFRPARVKSGVMANDRVEIISGLREGETIVTSAQFMIDSEASLDPALMRLDSEEADAMPAMDHSTMDHSSMNHDTMDHNALDKETMDHNTMDPGYMEDGTMDHESMDHSMQDGENSKPEMKEMDHD